MKREKSCGALVVRKNGESYDLVLLRHRFGGHWSFPKGHVEAGENEQQTALREVREETGLTIRLLDGFRESVEYFPKPGVKKQVVYFLGEALGDKLVRQEAPNPVVNVAVSFLCAMQVNSFRTVRGLPYASTMCTGNLRSGSQHLWRFLFRGDREAGARAGAPSGEKASLWEKPLRSKLGSRPVSTVSRGSPSRL